MSAAYSQAFNAAVTRYAYNVWLTILLPSLSVLPSEEKFFRLQIQVAAASWRSAENKMELQTESKFGEITCAHYMMEMATASVATN